jgi:hypothetical protein
MTGDPHLYYSSFSSELCAKFRRVGHLVAHNSTTGTYHEEILRSVLRNFLSKRFSVKTGFVYKNETEVSNQLDIIVVDENEVGAYLYQEGELAIVRPRAAVATIEVKTRVDGRSFEQALMNIASVRRLDSKIQGFVFGYESAKLTDKVLDGWFKRKALLDIAPDHAPSLVTFLKESAVLLHADDHFSISDCGQFRVAISGAAAGLWPVTEADGDGWQLQILLALIHGACLGRDVTDTHNERMLGAVRDLSHLLTFAGSVTKTDHFEFGVGYVPPHSTAKTA